MRKRSNTLDSAVLTAFLPKTQQKIEKKRKNSIDFTTDKQKSMRLNVLLS